MVMWWWVVAIFYFFFNFSGGELLFVAKFWWNLESGCVGLPERETEGKKRENELFILFNIVGYIILISYMLK